MQEIFNGVGIRGNKKNYVFLLEKAITLFIILRIS